MRSVCLILLLITCGCDFDGSRSDPNRTIKKGKDRVTLKFVPSGVPVPGGVGFDFHSLVWERQEGDFWQERAVITQEQFQTGSDRRRTPHDLYSFDPNTGNVVIKIAEGDAPTNADSVHFVYSWREWNIRTNGQVRLIRVCKDPFERF